MPSRRTRVIHAALVLACVVACGASVEERSEDADPCAEVRLFGWSRIGPPAGTEGLRAGHTAVWTGTDLLVWAGAGGAPGKKETPTRSDGVRWRPSTEELVPLADDGAPPPRWDHYAAWTGEEMLVWGARPGAGRYDPARDRWRAMAEPGNIAPPFEGVNVWTGGEWVIWGGTVVGDFEHPDYTVVSHEGARYDPTTDRWMPLPTGGAPGELYKATGVWTGSEVFIAGGDPMGDGRPRFARYAPGRDTWSPVSEGPGAPDGFSPPNVVWTGREVIVDEHTDGGRYDPVTDTWRPMSMDGSVIGTGVWTGRRLVVLQFGDRGFDAAAYDPESDSWMALPVDDCAPHDVPLGPPSVTVTWVDVGLVVWGNDGGRERGWFLSIPP